MHEGVTAERIGRALQALAADLATARRELNRLRRENHALRAKLAALDRLEEEDMSAGPPRRDPPATPQAADGASAVR